ncbi:trichohyalin isoform X2 [Antennarius striatus]|uniref:trichohyalin isoform X2 n=1 Tax=Antennarius striatus TaxID=241820 RepID=UPI0035AFDF3E
MGTKKPSNTIYDKTKTSDRNLHPGERISRDPSPRPAMTAQSERDRDGNREEDWRRERETEKMKDKTRYRDMDPRERYYERDRAPVPTPRQRRQEDDNRKNGRPLSHVESEREEAVRGMRKGDTFPRMRRGGAGHSKSRTTTEKDGEEGERRQKDRPKGLETDGWQRERCKEREADEIRSRTNERERNPGRRPLEETSRQKERYLESDVVQNRRRELVDSWDRRERDADRKRGNPRDDMGRRERRVSSPHRIRERDNYTERKEREKPQRKDGWRNTRSEGDSEEREMRRERDRDRRREELQYQHSQSEGENTIKTNREKDRDRRGYREEDRQRYRDREREGDRSRRRGVEKDRERYREFDRRGQRQSEEEDKYKVSLKDMKDDRKEDGRFREYKQRRWKETMERESDPKWDDSTDRSSRSLNERAPRVPQAQSSGEWSTTESEKDVEEQINSKRVVERSKNEKIRYEKQDREGVEMTGSIEEQRRMWLEPQRGKNSKGEFADTERYVRKRSKESQVEWGSDGQTLYEQPYDRYLDHSSYRGQCEGRREYKGNLEWQTEGVSVDGEEMDEEMDETGKEIDKRRKGHLSHSDGEIEGNWQRDAEGENVTDSTEESDREEEGGSDYWVRSESEGGSETGEKQDRYRILSGEDGFVTVSSGGDEGDERDEDEEEEFEDCQEFWDVVYDGSSPALLRENEREKGREDEWTTGNEELVDKDKQGKEKQPKYIFCVIGHTLPKAASGETSLSQVDQVQEVESDNPVLKSHPYSQDNTQKPQDDQHVKLIRNEYPIINNQEKENKSKFEIPGEEKTPVGEIPEVDIRHRVLPELENKTVEGMRQEKEHPYAEIGPINRDSLTERLLTEWREKNKETGRERERPSPLINSFDNEQIQPILDVINSGAMSPEEMEAIRIRLSGAWSMSEEPKRHSQAPHLKWAKDVLQEILGHSEDQSLDESGAGVLGGKGVNQPEIEIRYEKQHTGTEDTGEMPVLKLGHDGLHSEPELEEEPLEVEGLRDDEDDKCKSWGEVELRNVLDTIEKRKRNSRFFNAAQLYQQYSEAAQNFEILRQARSDAISLSEDATRSPAPSPPPARRPLPPLPTVQHPHSFSHTGSITSVRSLPLPEPPKREGRPPSPRLSISLSSTLWRDLPGVRNSTELEELSEDQRRLQEVRFELVTSEASYCRSLDIVVEHFVKSKQLGALLTTQDRNWLFSRLADVRAISHSFLSKLEERVETDIISFTVCDIIARHCQRFKMVYVPYLTNQSYQDATYQRLMNENQGFRRIVEKLERSPVCQRLPLRSFLVLPFQRITRIKLLVQNIVKRTSPGTTEATQAIKALKLLEKLIQESNDSITQMKSIESLVSLSAKVDFECRTLPLISQSRRLVREGPVTELMDFSLKETERNIYLHLFNDYLLLSLQKEGGRFTVIDHSPVSELRVENCRVKLHSLQKNLFRLHMSRRALLLRTDTQSDKLRWISALSLPHPEVDFSAAQDFTQMQCIRAFVAQQPDELSLEKADIILVHQQSSDNWVEGTRVSDRHRGWVTNSHLETITNSRVRQRNLSDALKLTTATAAV